MVFATGESEAPVRQCRRPGKGQARGARFGTEGWNPKGSEGLWRRGRGAGGDAVSSQPSSLPRRGGQSHPSARSLCWGARKGIWGWCWGPAASPTGPRRVQSATRVPARARHHPKCSSEAVEGRDCQAETFSRQTSSPADALTKLQRIILSLLLFIFKSTK